MVMMERSLLYLNLTNRVAESVEQPVPVLEWISLALMEPHVRSLIVVQDCYWMTVLLTFSILECSDYLTFLPEAEDEQSPCCSIEHTCLRSDVVSFRR